MIKYLKSKWKIKNNYQLLIILIVFTIAGSSVLFVRRFFFDLIGIVPDTHLAIKIPAYILIVTPSYFFILLIVAAIFGQFKFFLQFEKRLFLKITKGRNKKNSS